MAQWIARQERRRQDSRRENAAETVILQRKRISIASVRPNESNCVRSLIVVVFIHDCPW